LALLKRGLLDPLQERGRYGTALAGALCTFAYVVAGGFTNRSLRAQVAALLGVPYSSAQMSYDLRRLRLKGLIQRLDRRNFYVPTPDGILFAVFYTKLENRLLRPLMAADRAPAPPHLRQALRTIERSVEECILTAKIAA
jgi:hypothetical protein